MIFTAGLGNDDSAVIVAMIGEAEVTHLVDIRSWPHNDKFESHESAAIQNVCKVLGIVYDWKLDLAPSSRLRRRFAGIKLNSKKSWEEYSTEFEEHLKTIEGKRGLSSIKHLIASGANVCLLCAEKRPDRCHRLPVAEQVSRMTKVEIVHLVLGEDPRIVKPRMITRQSMLFP